MSHRDRYGSASQAVAATNRVATATRTLNVRLAPRVAPSSPPPAVRSHHLVPVLAGAESSASSWLGWPDPGDVRDRQAKRGHR
jgi:hypothetical protein